MLQLTHPQETFKFSGFITEALNYIDAWTPTMINSGGCGIFAALLSDKLKEADIKHEIYALYFLDESDDAEKNLSEYIKNGTNLSKAGEDHICIKVDDTYLDSTGIINPCVLVCRNKILISRDQLSELNSHGDWNPTFDRSCTQFIKDKLDYVFNEYDNFITGFFKYPKDGDVKYTPYTIKMRMKAVRNSFSSILPSGL